MLNDPLANALSAIKNAEIKGKGTCIIQPSSKLIGGVLDLLKESLIEEKLLVVEAKILIRLLNNLKSCVKSLFPLMKKPRTPNIQFEP